MELVVAAEAAHGASMLHPERSKGVEVTRARLLAYFADPDPEEGVSE